MLSNGILGSPEIELPMAVGVQVFSPFRFEVMVVRIATELANSIGWLKVKREVPISIGPIFNVARVKRYESRLATFLPKIDIDAQRGVFNPIFRNLI